MTLADLALMLEDKGFRVSVARSHRSITVALKRRITTSEVENAVRIPSRFTVTASNGKVIIDDKN